ncbi:hypothetical protein V492_08345 [Pseudogymnoascus sp. VKM F-4246]|nr:hypothetical protein V492_08345 [Pseudogymnoascus sp. VKM F-4246]
MEALWNNPNYQNPGAPAGPIHEDHGLCMHLLQSLPSSAPIELGPSTLHSGGTGLFARKPIRGGAQIFRSKPLVCCVADEKRTTICDYCYTDRFSPESYFGYQGRDTTKMFMCPGCEMTGYCSVVRILTHDEYCHVDFANLTSARAARAGEEITLSYIDLGAGIHMRDETLKNGYSFACYCYRCRRETAELTAIAHSRGFDIDIFSLSDFGFAAFKQNYIFKHNMFDMIPNMQEHPDDIVTSSNKDVFPIYPWPSTIFPMAYLQFYYARLYRTISEHRTAVMYALQGCFGMITRSGPEWLTFLHVLVGYYGHALRTLLPMAHDLDEVQQKRYEDFYLGLVHELLVRARNMYGSDSRYTLAVKEFHDAAMRDAMVNANATLPGTQGFREMFNQAQINVLTLAGVDPTTGIGLSQLSAWRGEPEVRLWNGTEYVVKQV